MSISTLLSSSISPYLCLPPPVRNVHFGIEPFWGHIAVIAMMRGENEMLRVGWLPHRSSHAFDDVTTPVLDRALAIVIPSCILESI
jgi:hypothetical protein